MHGGSYHGKHLKTVNTWLLWSWRWLCSETYISFLFYFCTYPMYTHCTNFRTHLSTKGYLASLINYLCHWELVSSKETERIWHLIGVKEYKINGYMDLLRVSIFSWLLSVSIHYFIKLTEGYVSLPCHFINLTAYIL